MGTPRGGNGGNRPPDNGGSSDGLPGLPPEWGVIVIPDDPAELAEEAATVRRLLRRDARRNRWRRRLHLKARGSRSLDDDSPAIGVPLLIMAIAVIATLTSLFAVAWPGHPPATARASMPARLTGTAANSGQLPDVTLVDLTGVPVRLRAGLPAVVVLIDNCRCTEFVAAAAAADPTINVLAVISKPVVGVPLPNGARIRVLLDPTATVRSAVPDLPTGSDHPTVLLVADDARLVKVVPEAGTVEDFRGDLGRLHH
jgi:hypothetical protein